MIYYLTIVVQVLAVLVCMGLSITLDSSNNIVDKLGRINRRGISKAKEVRFIISLLLVLFTALLVCSIVFKL